MGRLLRGLGVLVLALAFVFAGVFIADRWFILPTLGFRLALAAFCALGVGLFLRVIVRPAFARISPGMLAALFERTYPQCAERVITSVGLDNSLVSSPPVLAWLNQTTETDVHGLDERRAFALRPALCFALLGALALTTLLSALAWPPYTRFAGRFFTAWGEPDVGYRVTVEPGDTWIARGRLMTVGAQLVQDDPDRPPPEDVFLVFQTVSGPPQRARMDTAGEGRFLFTWPALNEAVEYRVEAGELGTSTYHVGVVDPIHLAQKPTIRIAPPPYLILKDQAVRTVEGEAAFEALQYSRLDFQFFFERRPARVTLKVTEAPPDDSTDVLPVLLDDTTGGIAARMEAKAKTFAASLLIEAEHGICTTVSLPGWKVRADTPPWFSEPLRLKGASGRGSEAVRVVSPSEPLRLQTTVNDAEGLGEIHLESQLNDEPTRSERWADGAGQTITALERVFVPARALKEGDRLRFRVRALDNRSLKKSQIGPSLPATDLVPHVAYDPPSAEKSGSWLELKVELGAESLVAKEIADQHETLAKDLDKIKQLLRQEHAQLGVLRQELHQQASLSAEKRRSLVEARRLNQEAVELLLRTGQQTANIPELAPLAGLLIDIAETDLVESERALSRLAQKDRPAPEREKDVQVAETSVLQALKRLEGVATLANQLAQDRLDQFELERLAQQERDLARRTEAHLAAKNPDDPSYQKELAGLRAEQARLAARLQALRAKSRRLQEALAARPTDRAAEIAERMAALAKKQRALNQEMKDKVATAAEKPFVDLARKQADLAKRVQKEVGDEREMVLPPFTEAREAAGSLEKGEWEKAGQQQEKTEADLHAWAVQLRSLTLPTMPRKREVQEFAQQQLDLQRTLEKLGEDFSRLPESEFRTRYRALTDKQKLLADALDKLDARLANDAKPILQRAQELARQAAEALAKRNALQSFGHMEDAHAALAQLARLVPDAPAPLPGEAETARMKAASARLERVQTLALEQKQLREEVRRGLEKTVQGSESPPMKPLQAEAARLAKDVLNLSQQGNNPEMKQAAGKAAHAAEVARQAMEKLGAAQTQGEPRAMKAAADEAVMKIDQAQQALESLAMRKPEPATEDTAKDRTAEALHESERRIQMAQEQLQDDAPKSPRAMRQAAEALDQTASHLAQQSQQSLPQRTARAMSGAKSGGAGQGGLDSTGAGKLETFRGQSWGALPGELKTRLMQELRGRYGDDYGPIIQNYFERIADVELRMKTMKDR